MYVVALECPNPYNKDWPHLLSLPRQYLARPSVKLTEHSHCYVGQSGTCSRHPGAAWSLLHPPLHGHGANVPPAPVQAPGGLLDGVALSLVGTGIGVVQEDVADVINTDSTPALCCSMSRCRSYNDGRVGSTLRCWWRYWEGSPRPFFQPGGARSCVHFYLELGNTG